MDFEVPALSPVFWISRHKDIGYGSHLEFSLPEANAMSFWCFKLDSSNYSSN